jgi:tetratricopeptide (TPR) repeat protein
MAEKRVTRKELLKSPDEFLTFSDKAIRFVRAHSQKFMTGITIALAVLAIVLGIRWYLDYSNKQAIRAYNEAMSLIDPGGEFDPQKAEATVKALENMTKEYGRYSVARTALLDLGRLNYQLKKYPPAREAYRKFLDTLDPKEKDLKPLVLDSIAYVFEAEGNFEQAIANWQAVTSLPGNLLKEEAYMSLGRVYEAAGRAEDSKKAYLELIAEFPESSGAQLAKIKLQGLDR